MTTIAALRDAVSGTTARVVHLSGTVDTGDTALSIGSNKTLRGVDKNAKIVGGIVISGQSNVIIQNLTVQGKGQGYYPADSAAASGSHHLWFDHLNILDGGDGILDLTNGSDRATVSWCKFWYTNSTHTHRLALLFGNSSEKCDVDTGKNNHTVHHSWFSTLVDQRMLRLLFGKGHVFNNYYNAPGNEYCVGSGSWGSILIENNYFKDVNSPHQFQDGHPSFMKATGNVYDNTTGNKDTGRGGTDAASTTCEIALGEPGEWAPSYAYKLDAAASVPGVMTKCAGPQ
jgi:pectate lyase